MHVHKHKHQLYLLEQHSKTFTIWSAIISINTEGNSLIMKLGPDIFFIVNQNELDDITTGNPYLKTKQ